MRYFYEIFSVCTCQQVAFKFLVWLLLGDKQPSYDDFSAVGAFSLKFSVAPNGENTDRIKKVRGCKNGTELLYHHAKYGGDRGSRAGCRRKSVIILRLSRQKCGNTAPKTVKISNFGHKFAPQGLLVCPIFTKFSDFVRV